MLGNPGVCTRNLRAQDKRFGNGQMKMVGNADDPDQLASYLGKPSAKNEWLIGSRLVEWGYLGLGSGILRPNE
jgi:hypothetical protein